MTQTSDRSPPVVGARGARPDLVDVAVGENVRAARLRVGLSQGGLGRAIGVDRAGEDPQHAAQGFAQHELLTQAGVLAERGIGIVVGDGGEDLCVEGGVHGRSLVRSCRDRITYSIEREMPFNEQAFVVFLILALDGLAFKGICNFATHTYLLSTLMTAAGGRTGAGWTVCLLLIT